MQVFVWKGAGNWYGFTPTDDSSCLAADKGPWRRFKEISMNRNEAGQRTGISSEEVLDAFDKGSCVMAEIGSIITTKTHRG
jgi:hypothetical protein